MNFAVVGSTLRMGLSDFQWKNPDFLFNNPDFLSRNPDFLLENVDFIIKQPFAVTLNFPMIDFNTENGPIRQIPGTVNTRQR